MHLALIHSNQPANQYVGGGNGVDDSEQAWMRRLALGLADELRALGVTVTVGPVGPTFATNVAWVNATKGFDRLISLHSNAMGDACILWGSSAASKAFADALRRELDAAAILPFGDKWELDTRKVSETTKTYPPAALLEVGQHDRQDYADWLRAGITSGNYARALAAPIARALGLSVEASGAAVEAPAAEPSAPATPATLAVDGKLGPLTIKALQRWLGVTADGIIGPATRKALQARLGVAVDGIWGRKTHRALQALVGANADGIWGPETTKALQRYLNNH